MNKKIILILTPLIIAAGIGMYGYTQMFSSTVKTEKEKIVFEVKNGDSVSKLANRLEQEKIIDSAFFFKLYNKVKGYESKIQTGVFELVPPYTVARVADAFTTEGKSERSITLIPGWDLRDMAEYFEKEGIATKDDVYAITGKPAQFTSTATSSFEKFSILKGKPNNVSLEGYLAPETYRIYKNEKIESILKRLLDQRQKEFTVQMLTDIKSSGRTVHEVLTLASIVEKEVKSLEDRKMVADLFLRRIELGWGLQADSTVHYLSGREGDVFTKAQERQIDSLWNTYKYRDLPPAPISNPSINSIMAAIYPTKNDYWYFLTTFDGEVKYAKTLEEHNRNVQKYLR